jgi:hypothetical protein
MTGTEVKFTDNKISVSKVIGTGKRGAWSNENIDIVGNKFTRKIEKSDKNLAFEIAWNNLNRVSRFLGLPERVLVK